MGHHIIDRTSTYKKDFNHGPAINHKHRAEKALKQMHQFQNANIGHDAREKAMGLHQKANFSSYDLMKNPIKKH
ncbi:MAG: hypothetical protein ACRDBX_05680 [Erysipelotrichaceae bacterium]